VPSAQEQFEDTAIPHLRSLLRVARRLSLDPAAAEDLVQETMLLAWRGFHQFEAGTNARAWLFRILFNVFYGQGRKAARVDQPALFDDRVRPALQEAAEIAQALNRLSIEQRSVFLLAAVEGFTSRQIAGILDVPIGTVMSRLSRAREELRRILSPMEARKAKEAYR
jgi:RNA polymerase sigma-70 factor (ECF subfamily)